MRAGLAAFASPASATLITRSGKISQLFLSAGTNFGYRVYLDAGISGCTGGFAYINSDFNNYQAFVSALTTAYAIQKSLDLILTVEASGYCQIAEFTVR